jgi:hypothetical protein
MLWVSFWWAGTARALSAYPVEWGLPPFLERGGMACWEELWEFLPLDWEWEREEVETGGGGN